MSIQTELEKEWGPAALAEPEGEFRDGFGLRSVLGGLFLAFIMLPGAIYLFLVAGGDMGLRTSAQWVTVILFAEIARRCFTRLSRQEIYVLYLLGGGLVVAGGPFLGLLRNQYLIQSIYADQFGIVKEIGDHPWIAPPLDSIVYGQRTLFHRDWWPAIQVLFISMLLGRMNNFALGYALFRVTSDIERLPFPMAPVAAQGATALAESYDEKESWRWRLFTIGTAIGICFGSLYILVPAVTGGVMNTPVQILKIPWWDFTQSTQQYLPAALTGLDTNFTSVIFGFVLPFWMVAGQFIASIACQVFLNPILHYYGVLTYWKSGMDSITTAVGNDLDFWLSVRIGASLTIALLGIAFAAKAIFCGGARGPAADYKGRGNFPTWLALAIWACGQAALVALCHYLVPTFPWWVLALYGFLWTPLNSYVSARMIGLTGSPVTFSYLREASFILCTRYINYSGIAIWFAPIPLHDNGGMAGFFREMTLTRTKFISAIKIELLVFPLLLVSSIVFCSFLWRLNPIPSAAYPYAAKMWPYETYWQCLWVTSTQTGESRLLEAVQPGLVGWSIVGGLSLWTLISLLGLPQFLFYGLVTGATMWPHYAILPFIGGMLGRFVLMKHFGRETWRRYVVVLAAGSGCGMGLMGMISIGITLISRSVIQLPY